MALWNPFFVIVQYFSFKIIHLQNGAYCFSYPFVFFLEWNIYLILKNHIDRKHPTSPPLWPGFFHEWMDQKKTYFWKRTCSISRSRPSPKKKGWFVFAACEFYTLRFAIPKQKIMAIFSRQCASSNLTNTPTSAFFLRKKPIPPPSMTFCVTGTGSIYLGSKPLGLKSVREKKQQGPRHHQSCIDLNHQNFWIKKMRFIYHVLTLRQAFRIWRFDKLTKSLKGFNFTKPLDPTNLISVRKSRHATKKTSKLQKNRSSWSKKSQLEANEILEFHTKVFQQADLLPQSTYLRDTSIHCFFDLNSISTRAPWTIGCDLYVSKLEISLKTFHVLLLEWLIKKRINENDRESFFQEYTVRFKQFHKSLNPSGQPLLPWIFPVHTKLTRTFVLRDKNMELSTVQQMRVWNLSLISHIWVLPIFVMSVRRPFPPFKPRSRNLNEILVRNPQKSWNCRTFTKGSKAPGDRIEFHLLLASITLQDLAGIPVVTKMLRKRSKVPSWFFFRWCILLMELFEFIHAFLCTY